MLTLGQATDLESFFTAAYSEYEKELKSYAFFKTHNPAACQDLVQETFLRTWQYLLREGKIHTLGAFLYHVLNNLIVDEYRKRKSVSLDLLLENNLEPRTDSFDQFIDALDGEEALLLVRRLPLPYQKIMRMRYVKSLTVEEIAARTGHSRNAVSVQLHRGLAKLRALYLQTPPSHVRSLSRVPTLHA